MHQLWGRHLVAATGAFRRRSSRPPATVPEDRIVTLKLALSDYTFPKLELEKVLRLARDLSTFSVIPPRLPPASLRLSGHMIWRLLMCSGSLEPSLRKKL